MDSWGLNHFHEALAPAAKTPLANVCAHWAPSGSNMRASRGKNLLLRPQRAKETDRRRGDSGGRQSQVEQLYQENEELYDRLTNALRDRRKLKPQVTTPQVKSEENRIGASLCIGKAVMSANESQAFHDTFFNQSQEGGWKAAAEFLKQINNDLANNFGSDVGNLDVKILAYANLKRLKEKINNNKWMKKGDKWVEKEDKHMIKDVDMVRFAQGFTAANPLIEFIDVGPGKERTHLKIKGFQTTLGWETVY
ncbi:MAG: hypothetical protein Q9221_004787 [Calogaya cf. arnoldii]